MSTERLMAELREISHANAKENFARLYCQACKALDLDDESAACLVDTSRSNASRWRRGLVIPPAAFLVLRFLGAELTQRSGDIGKLLR